MVYDSLFVRIQDRNITPSLNLMMYRLQKQDKI